MIGGVLVGIGLSAVVYAAAKQDELNHTGQAVMLVGGLILILAGFVV